MKDYEVTTRLVGRGLRDDQPQFVYVEGNENIYSNIFDIEDVIVEEFSTYEEEGWNLDTENLVDLAVSWRNIVADILDLKGEVKDSDIADAYSEALTRTY